MNWYQITIHTVSEAVEAVSYMLEQIPGIQGVEITDPGDILRQKKEPASWDYIDEDLLAAMNPEEVLVRFYVSFAAVPTETALEALTERVEDGLANIALYLPIGEGRLEVCVKNEDEWANAWKKYYTPFRLGQRIHIVPSWAEADEPVPGEVLIRMDPGMAFGTGTHETTAMCITMLEELIQGGETVYDIGTGSGILAIAAAKLGAGKVVCSDIDADAVRVAKENVAANQVESAVEVLQGDLLKVPSYRKNGADIVVANIIADVIIALAPAVPAVLQPDGWFLSSGIIEDRLGDVEKALTESGYTIVKTEEKGGWAAVLSRKQEL